jgi:hypothetical protein
MFSELYTHVPSILERKKHTKFIFRVLNPGCIMPVELIEECICLEKKNGKEPKEIIGYVKFTEKKKASCLKKIFPGQQFWCKGGVKRASVIAYLERLKSTDPNWMFAEFESIECEAIKMPDMNQKNKEFNENEAEVNEVEWILGEYYNGASYVEMYRKRPDVIRNHEIFTEKLIEHDLELEEVEWIKERISQGGSYVKMYEKNPTAVRKHSEYIKELIKEKKARDRRFPLSVTLISEESHEIHEKKHK